ncbi:DUF3883 domain-containing protein [Maribacter arcticus]|uniref:DUF3883 domain-containing protein n=1 Tax=Maribacter arcticus TaxID=561365 RepID=UPI0030011774
MIQNSISVTQFDETYSLFLEFIREESGNQEFLGFNQGHMYKAESYKNEIRVKSLAILGTGEWHSKMIGAGEIVKLVVDTLELKGNNLVDTNQKYGPDALVHKKLLDAIKVGTNLLEIEQVIFDLFKTNNYESNIISRLISLVGKKYSLIAFLFYLKNDRKYLPISTTNFQYAFIEIGCDLKLSQKCSWENYNAYLNVIRQVKNHLEDKLDEPINFIDAHSFLWLIGYKNRLRKWIDKKALPKLELVFNAYKVSPINNFKSKLSTLPNKSIITGDIDWDKENRNKRIKGRRAEELVIEYERRRLVSLNKYDLSKKIEDYSKNYGEGFDVLSWNKDGTPRNIEVKSSGSNGFIITRNELNKSEEDPNYWIYILNETDKEVQIKKIKAPSLRNNSQFKLEPKDYYVSFSIEN